MFNRQPSDRVNENVLLEIDGCKEDRLFDIVFIHGLDGHPKATWEKKTSRGILRSLIQWARGPTESHSWQQSLARQYPEAGIWSLGYPGRFYRMARPRDAAY